ncbi:MAG: DUF937 domain-containing protein [Pseudomonadota bacterium]
MVGLLDLLGGERAMPARQQLSQQFGLSPQDTDQAMRALIPALSAGLKANASEPGGLEGLLSALQGGGHERYVDNPSLLSRTETRDDGNGILGHLLGSKDMSRSVASQAAQKTGLSDGLMKQMLPLLATLVMGQLSKQSQQPDIVSQLSGLLGGGQAQRPPAKSGALGGLLGGLLGGGRSRQAPPAQGQLGALSTLFDADRDGSAMDDIFQMVLKGRGS